MGVVVVVVVVVVREMAKGGVDVVISVVFCGQGVSERASEHQSMRASTAPSKHQSEHQSTQHKKHTEQETVTREQRSLYVLHSRKDGKGAPSCSAKVDIEAVGVGAVGIALVER